ncbi:MAG: 3-oxoacyl-[acyl-carrier-protein] synthase-3 [Arenicella sp.]|jgi:3-oxoacyl-[acyl-carrier-protein] synthase-3
MNRVKIIGVGTHLPGPQIDNEKIQEKFSVNAEWVELMIGNRFRHLVVDLDTGAINASLADICTDAALAALDRAYTDADEIEFIVMGTATPDQLMPATVNMVAQKLGINGVSTYQLQSGCAGAIQALDLGHKLIKTGTFHKGLVIGGDICAKYIDLKQDYSDLDPAELVNYALFGDGAGAAVLSADDGVEGIEILHTLNRCEGLNREPGQELNWRGSFVDDDAPQPLKEGYQAIEANVPDMALETMNELIAKAGWKLEEITHFMTPQLAGNMTDKIITHMGVAPERALNCVADTGNNGNGLPFLQLQMLQDKAQPGDTAITVAIESSKWIKGGLVLQAG